MPARPRGGLGRGLESLIPEPEIAPSSLVPVANISANPYQPRSTMDAAELESLAESIRENGVLQPLLVQPDGDNYRLIAGHRRLEAARSAGLDRVPVYVRPSSPDDNVLLLALVENLQRSDLSPLDEAAAYR
ncbi:MAG: ParB/RepB/Spo0J family partition protein, partial [Chloroflexia bacterium]